MKVPYSTKAITDTAMQARAGNMTVSYAREMRRKTHEKAASLMMLERYLDQLLAKFDCDEKT